MSRRWLRGAGAAAAAALLVGAGGCAADAGGGSDGGGTITFGSVGGLTDAGLYLADERGYFEDEGLTVQFERMDNAPALTNAIATEQLDVAGISVSPGMFSSVTQGIDLTIVGDKQSLRPEFSATRLVAKSEFDQGSTESTLRALAGKTVAISAAASSVHMLLRDLLEQYGMTTEDIRLTELSYGNMTSALASGAADAAVMLEPFLTQAMGTEDLAVVSDFTELLPPEGVTLVPLVYSNRLVEDDRERGAAFMRAYLRGVRDYNDAFREGGDGRDEAVETIAARAEVAPAVVEQAFPAGLDPDQHVNVEFLGQLQDFFVETGDVREPVDVADLVDSSFAEAAVAELGEYE